MSRIKTLILYVLGIIVFYIFSQLIINISLESTYQKIEREDNIKQVIINQAEATIANGRIKGVVINPEDDKINGKYLKFDFYSQRDVLKGTKYIDISELKVNETQELEMYFKLENVDYYNVSTTDKKKETEIELLPKDLTQPEIILATMIVLMTI